MTSGVLLSGAVAMLALPSAVLAFSSTFAPRQEKQSDAESLQVARLSARLAPALSARSLGKGQMFHFTPANSSNRPDRSVTVAVRIGGRLSHSSVPENSNRSAPGAFPCCTSVRSSSSANFRGPSDARGDAPLDFDLRVNVRFALRSGRTVAAGELMIRAHFDSAAL